MKDPKNSRVRFLLLFALGVSTLAAAPHAEILTTPDGVRFGFLGPKPSSPEPTVFWFGKTIENTLEVPYDQDALDALGPNVLKVSLDMPGHGADHRANEPKSLTSWRYRLEHGENIAADLVRRASAVLDYLVQERYTDPARVAVFGTSRGGLMALHFASADSRVRPIVLFSPVTDLLTLHELSEMEHDENARALAAVRLADRLYEHPIWLVIGNTDHRVGTASAIEFTERILESAEVHGQVPPIQLRVLPAKGHTTPDGSHLEAVHWLLKQWNASGAH